MAVFHAVTSDRERGKCTNEQQVWSVAGGNKLGNLHTFGGRHTGRNAVYITLGEDKNAFVHRTEPRFPEPVRRRPQLRHVDVVRAVEVEDRRGLLCRPRGLHPGENGDHNATTRA
jgi:hypothetical protein